MVLANVDRDPSDGFLLTEVVKIAGAGRNAKPLADACGSIGRGKSVQLFAQPEPTNLVDPNAYVIRYSRPTLLGSKNGVLGYVPRDTSARIAALRAMAEVKVIPVVAWLPRPGFNASLELGVFAKPNEGVLAPVETVPGHAPTTTCPYGCGHQFDETPTRSRKCPGCGEKIARRAERDQATGTSRVALLTVSEDEAFAAMKAERIKQEKRTEGHFHTVARRRDIEAIRLAKGPDALVNLVAGQNDFCEACRQLSGEPITLTQALDFADGEHCSGKYGYCRCSVAYDDYASSPISSELLPPPVGTWAPS